MVVSGDALNITGSVGIHNDTITTVPVLIQPVVFSRGFSRISPSDNDVCVGASVGMVLALSCSWHAATGTVRMHLPAGIVTYHGSLTTHSWVGNNPLLDRKQPIVILRLVAGALLQTPTVCEILPKFSNCSAEISFVRLIQDFAF